MGSSSVPPAAGRRPPGPSAGAPRRAHGAGQEAGAPEAGGPCSRLGRKEVGAPVVWQWVLERAARQAQAPQVSRGAAAPGVGWGHLSGGQRESEGAGVAAPPNYNSCAETAEVPRPGSARWRMAQLSFSFCSPEAGWRARWVESHFQFS